jgi:hypothetical protein
MKKNLIPWTLAAALLCPVGLNAQGWMLTLDEYGAGTYLTNGISTPLSGQLLSDPSGGIAGNVLIYTLPFNFQQSGDYFMTNTFEPMPLGQASDLIRFWGINQVIFYSDNDGPSESAPADTGLPPSLLSPNVGLSETGIEGNTQQASHQTFAGDPGFAGLVGGQGITYVFISDVPEPNSLIFTGCGLAVLMLANRWRKQ